MSHIARSAALGIALAFACSAPVPTSTTSASPSPVASQSRTPAATSAATLPVAPTPEAPSPLGVLQILAIARLDARVGWVSTQTAGQPSLLRTADGGTTWQRYAAPTFLTQLAFVDAQSGWARGEPTTCRTLPTQCKRLIETTTDGGRTWTQRLSVDEGDVPGRGPALLDLAAIDSQRAWITVRTNSCDPAGCAHEIRGTEDGGATWKVLRQPQPVSQIARTSASTGWALGPFAVRNGGEILGTADGGATWTSQFRSELQPMQLTARSDRAAWALYRDPTRCTASSCASYDLVRTTDGTGWSSVGNPWNNVTGDRCGGMFSQMAFGDERTGWLTVNHGAGGVVGSGGILRTTDGGRSWTCQTEPPDTVLVSAPSAQRVWVTSRDRSTGAETLWASEDGGQSWQRLSSLPPVSRSIDLCGRITEAFVGDLPSGGFITVDGVKYLVGTVDPTLNVRLPPLDQVVVGARACIRGEAEPVGTPPIADVFRLRNAVVTIAAT